MQLPYLWWCFQWLTTFHKQKKGTNSCTLKQLSIGQPLHTMLGEKNQELIGNFSFHLIHTESQGERDIPFTHDQLRSHQHDLQLI